MRSGIETSMAVPAAWLILSRRFAAEYGLMVGYLRGLKPTSPEPLALAHFLGPKFQLSAGRFWLNVPLVHQLTMS